MTKSQAKEFLRLNEGAFAVHPNNGKELRISCNEYRHTGVLLYKRLVCVAIDNWLDDCFFGNPDDGWFIELPA